MLSVAGMRATTSIPIALRDSRQRFRQEVPASFLTRRSAERAITS
jgi:hypothetical protein